MEKKEKFLKKERKKKGLCVCVGGGGYGRKSDDMNFLGIYNTD